MAQIYEHAEDVIVYLGEPTEETHLGMVMLQAIMDRHEPEDVPAWKQIPIPVLEKGVADILRRPWFTRMWTVQEATLAHHITMMCGRYRFSWRVELRHVMAAIFRIKATVISPAFDWGAKQQSTLDWLPLLDILEAQSRQAARREGATLHRNQLDLAFTFRHRKAHDPRDKIFAISNIVEHENDEHNKVELRLLHADYEETLEEIHSRFEREIKRIAGIEDAHLLTFQNSALILAMYEMSKSLPSNTTLATLSHTLTTAIFTNESWKLAIPAVLYTIQNNLQYLAVSNLDAATFQVTYQLKILTTAIFSVLMLGRTLSMRKWFSLLLLIVGVSIIQVPQATSPPATPETESTTWAKTLEHLHDFGSNAAVQMAKRSGSYEGIHEDRAAQVPHMNSRVGLLAVLISCALSGLAGVTFEKILKDSTSTKTTTLWVRNCQLSFWSIFPSLFLGVIWKDGEIIAKTGFFVGYNWVVWTAIGFQAAGGVIVALVINYADNIAKNFATSISILLSCIASVYFFNFQVTQSFFLGTCVVLFATYLYTKPERGMQSSVPIADFEKTTVDRSYDENEYDAMPRTPSRVVGRDFLHGAFSFRLDISHLTPSLTISTISISPPLPSITSSVSYCLHSSIREVGMGDRHYRPEDFERADHPRHASRYDILQPQFRQPARPVPLRDRYRSTQYGHAVYDAVEDDHVYDHDPQFDSFDDRLLQQPYFDRQQQAAQGRTRLSRAPGPSMFFNNAAPVHSQPPRHTRPNGSHGTHEGQQHTEQAMRSHLSRFAYNGALLQDSSSDSQVGPSSSPAFKASQRRVEQAPFPDYQLHQISGNNQPDYEDPYQQMMHVQNRKGVVQQHSSLTYPTDDALSRGQQAPSQLQATFEDPSHAPPVCQGIRLVPVTTLPDRLRTLFPYPTFNAVQSKCFDNVFRTDDNFVLASPTGSGKTVILELAVCRAVGTSATGQYKIVYQAPTKALCSERQRDWEPKFNKIGLKCAELTGDSNASDLRNVQSANIIITTPEKWDSMTRKWKDHERLMRLIRVFLIDEVHILKEDRGATLEAVVSRMKSIGTDVRFVALSATVPNFDDIATWLGRSSSEPDTPARNAKFGEEFRPVKLRKHVYGHASNANNEFGFERALDAKITDVIATYSERKPMMVFCATRNSTVSTAKLIVKWWNSLQGKDRCWNAPSKSIPLRNKDLCDTVASGVAFHHAGLDINDRILVEKSFLAGEVNVICCTSTLAVGVNLPCHLVIIKNTVAWGAEGHQEYSDLEMMQMLGRAGRPQFDNTAVAVIMTRQSKVRRYELMAAGQELIESKLHLHLVDHMNAEIGLGTICDLQSARKWLKGTFLFVRLQQNPEYYKLEGARSGQSIKEQIDDICFRDINLLRESNLIAGEEYFRCTEFGHAMARYYVHFETMKVFMGLKAKCSPSEILSAIAQANEYSTIRFRQGEKPFYNILNRSPSIRWSIPVSLDLPAHKVSLIIQSVLGSADISWDGEVAKNRSQYTTETMMVFKNVGSLIRCIVDCQIVLGDSVSIHSALMLERSLGARTWDDSPLQMKQIETLGVVAVRKLVNAGIKCMEDLEGCDPHRIEALIGRNPPYGLQVLEKTKLFPKLRVSLNAQPSTAIKTPEGVKVQIKAAIGFMNEQPPQRFNNKIIYICLLVETSDGPGSMRSATVRPQIPTSMYPNPKSSDRDMVTPHQCNMSKRRIETVKATRNPSTSSEDFSDDGLDDDTLVNVTCDDLGFEDIENYADPFDEIAQKSTAKNKRNKGKNVAKGGSATKSPRNAADSEHHDPVQLSNGKWACNHLCKDREACKHLCCKEGMEKPPKKKHAAAKRGQQSEDRSEQQQRSSTRRGKETQTKLQISAFKRKVAAPIEELDLTQPEKKKKADYGVNGPRDYRGLHQLHRAVQGKELPSKLHSVMHTKPAYCYSQGGVHNLAFMDPSITEPRPESSDYGDIHFDEPPDSLDASSHRKMELGLRGADPQHDDAMDYKSNALNVSRGSETYGDDDSILGDAMVGLADSQNLQVVNEDDVGTVQSQGNDQVYAEDDTYADRPHWVDDEFLGLPDDTHEVDWEKRYPRRDSQSTKIHAQRSQPPFYDSTSSQSEHQGAIPVNSAIESRGNEDAAISETHFSVQQPANSNQQSRVEGDVPDLLEMFDEPASVPSPKMPVPDAFKDLEPWLFQEFGDIVELTPSSVGLQTPSSVGLQTPSSIGSQTPSSFGSQTQPSSVSPQTDASSSLTSSETSDGGDGPPPPPFQCNDFGHCFAVGDPTNANLCDPFNWVFCPGLPWGAHTPPSHNGLNHPIPNQVTACAHCMAHEIVPHYLPSKLAVVQRPAAQHARTGHRAQLCTHCIRDEVELYWVRQGQPAPAAPGFTVQFVTQWPNHGSIQDLCTCPQWAIQQCATTRCHTCRDTWFFDQSYQALTQNEDMLRTRTKPVIQGHRRCNLNGGSAQHAVSAATITARQNQQIGRMCPCGERPKAPNAPEYISVCLGCMGVRIDPTHLPAKYQLPAVLPKLQRMARLNQQFRPTRGPKSAPRSPNHRVNIERAWRHNQPDWVGNT
ncbi:atp-dependent dna helicase mer3 [Stemphylium lycopersici]|uniref:DNA 3'-5' helicase n=1 Tax=Stemphylium lycopersici TaxID=183478 RepID=A0A364MZK8_STELY|nr:atp-dependent dna helicase mer3 [Stemphylium lycopersici]